MLVVIATGNLGRDPETRYSQNGDPITNFSLACNVGKDKTEWVRCTCFKKTAEVAGQYLRKGSKVGIEGTLHTSTYEKNGEKRYSTKVIVNRFEFLSAKSEQQAPQQSAPDDDFDSAIPF